MFKCFKILLTVPALAAFMVTFATLSLLAMYADACPPQVARSRAVAVAPCVAAPTVAVAAAPCVAAPAPCGRSLSLFRHHHRSKSVTRSVVRSNACAEVDVQQTVVPFMLPAVPTVAPMACPPCPACPPQAAQAQVDNRSEACKECDAEQEQQPGPVVSPFAAANPFAPLMTQRYRYQAPAQTYAYQAPAPTYTYTVPVPQPTYTYTVPAPAPTVTYQVQQPTYQLASAYTTAYAAPAYAEVLTTSRSRGGGGCFLGGLLGGGGRSVTRTVTRN